MNISLNFGIHSHLDSEDPNIENPQKYNSSSAVFTVYHLG